MSIRDSLGLIVTGADGESLGHYEQALRLFQCYVGDPIAACERAAEIRPDFTMVHVLNAYLHLLGTDPDGIPIARASYDAAARLPATDRERGHVTAIGHLLAGHWQRGGLVLENVAIAHPTDALVLQAGHLVDFFRGDSRMLRDRIARALPAWSASMPGYHSVLGMHAFGLEETGHYAQAEAAGRKAVELERRDGWAQHAVAHVLEMQQRPHEGIAWMRANLEWWAGDSFFQVHNWWHLALYHLELEEIEQVLSLFDGPIYGPRSKLAFDMVDASALLWRLMLRGVDVSDRWQPLADDWSPLARAGNYAFNDVHAVMAFVGADRKDLLEAVLQTQREALHRDDDNAAFTREVGYPVALALRAFGDGNYAECVRRLRPVRSIAHRFGGSHAQRDLLDLTLLEAAFRDGQHRLSAALTAERLSLKPASPWAKVMAERALAKSRAA